MSLIRGLRWRSQVGGRPEWRGMGLLPLHLSPFVFSLSLGTRGHNSHMTHDLNRAIIPVLVTRLVMCGLGKTCHERSSIAVGGASVFIREFLKLERGRGG